MSSSSSSCNIVTSRFTNDTWTLNLNYRERKNLCCVYASPQQLSSKISYNSLVFVIEMNNSINEIIGIGLIKNNPDMDKVYRIQNDANYNRYIYVGKYYISRETIKEYNEELIKILDEILFKGKTHSKRGLGMTKIPEKVLKSDICKNINLSNEIKKIFLEKYKNCKK